MLYEGESRSRSHENQLISLCQQLSNVESVALSYDDDNEGLSVGTYSIRFQHFNFNAWLKVF